MWEIEEVAAFFGVTIKVARTWIVKDKLCEFRLKRVGWAVKPIITSEELVKLMNVKRPVHGSGSDLDRIYDRNRAQRIRASIAGNLARARKKQERLEQQNKEALEAKS